MRHAFGALYLAATLALFACGEEGLRRASPVATLSGAICDESNKMFVPEATVTLIEQDADGTIVSQQDTATDQEGRFEFKGVVGGKHTLRAEKDGFVYQIEVTVRGNTQTVLPVPECAVPTGSVKGRICDAEKGEWVGGAEIYVPGPSGSVTATAPTASDGSFTLDGVPSGSRELIADKDGYKYAVPVMVRAGETVDLGIEDCVKSGLSNIEGQICANAPGNWLANARVSTTVEGSVSEVTTDIDGRYTLRGLPPGAYKVKVEKGAYVLEFDVETQASKTTRLEQPMCTPANIPVVVVSGEFDAIQKVMRRLQFSNVTVWQGYPDHSEVKDLAAQRTDPWCAALLDGAAPEIFNYKIAMFNSRYDLTDVGAYGSEQYERRLATLRRFVEEGGFLYVSDWAYDLLGSSFGAPVSFYGNGMQKAARLGVANTYKGTITEPSLSTLMAATELTVIMKNEWAVLGTLGPAVKTYATATVGISGQAEAAVPLLVSFAIGKGRVVFSSFATKDVSSTQIDKVMEFLVFEL